MPSRVDIRPVRTKADLTAFLQVPFEIYRHDPNWVPPLWLDRRAFFDFKKNPFYRTADVGLFLAFEGDRPCGRIAACVNRDFNEFHEVQKGSFGFFECPDDPHLAAALFDSAAEWVQARGADAILGPFNFSTNHEIGFLADAYDSPPMVMMPYNPPYYLELAEQWGLAKVKDVWAFHMERANPPAERIRKIAARVRERAGLTVRPMNMRDYEGEIERVRAIYNQAWSRNWGFVPLSEDEFQHIARDMKLIIRPNWALIAEVQGKPIGFSLTLPNVYESQIKLRRGRLLPLGWLRLLWDLKVRGVHSARVITMGVIHDFQKQGIESVLYIETYDRCGADGVQWAELSWVLEDNEMMVKAALALGARHYKTYRLFEKPLTN